MWSVPYYPFSTYIVGAILVLTLAGMLLFTPKSEWGNSGQQLLLLLVFVAAGLVAAIIAYYVRPAVYIYAWPIKQVHIIPRGDQTYQFVFQFRNKLHGE